MNALVEFAEVSKSFDGKPAVKRLSLSIARGEFVAIMGPSGCGKTTVLRMLAGFETPDEGEVRFAGERISQLMPWQRNVPMVWQNLALFPFLSVLQNVEFGLKMRGMRAPERKRRAMTWLERLHIADFAHNAVAQLSGGQRQRVALARTLVTEPEILLLDEPLSALDANMVTHMQGVLSNLQKEIGITFLYVTHSRAEAFAMADRVVVMNRGQICQTGSPAAIYRAPHTRFVARFIGDYNVFSGKPSRRNGEYQIKTADGEFLCKAPHDMPASASGEPVEVAVNAQDLSVSPSPLEGFENLVECELENEEFHGDVSLLRLRTNSGTLLTAQRTIGADWSPGSLRATKLYAQWRADCVLSLHHDPEE